jgi:hypothetical protein
MFSPPFSWWRGTEFTIAEATTGVAYQPRMIMSVEQSAGWLAGETEVLNENLFQCHFVHHKSHMTWHGPPATNRLSHS